MGCFNIYQTLLWFDPFWRVSFIRTKLKGDRKHIQKAIQVSTSITKHMTRFEEGEKSNGFCLTAFKKLSHISYFSTKKWMSE